MKIITEEREIVGTLVTQGQPFDLLELKPQTKFNTPLWLREHVFAFLVLDKDGYANTILVSRAGFYIQPCQTMEKKMVNFIVPEDKEERAEKIENSLLIRPFMQS